MARTLDDIVSGASKIALVGHVRPDGDCLGSLAGTFRYLTENHPELSVTVYAEEIAPYLQFLLTDVPVREGEGAEERYDLAIALDASNAGRIGAGSRAFREAARTAVIDHHETNPGFGDENVIVADASSTAEVLVSLMDPDRISAFAAEKLYTGIIQDSGVFRYKCTSKQTLLAAALLLDKGVDFTRIIEETVINQAYDEMRLTAKVIEESELFREEAFIVGYAPLSLQESFGLKPMNLGNVVVELNAVAEANVALFLYEHEDRSWKASLRAKCDLNMAAIAERFGGGGHARAAGFSFNGDPKALAKKIRLIIRSLKQA